MSRNKLIISVPCLIFSVYFANVVAGASGLGVFLSDLWEMLTLFVACIAFVIATLYLERTEKARAANVRGGAPTEVQES